MTNSKSPRFHDLTSIVLCLKLNRFSELSLSGSGGSSNVGIGKYKVLEDGFEVLNDMDEHVEMVKTFDEVLTALQVKEYITLEAEYSEIINWHKSNSKDYYSVDKTLEEALVEFNQSKQMVA